ncbi:MAG: type II toxin-antitoxin system VapC family toxin [bacterium]|nr:type II toxin-antitoxin system VapC family toxin [bacterium]
MIAFDTNILIRLVVEDDLAQWQLADQLLTRCVEGDQRCLISIPVLCETIWVLRRLYKASRDDIALTIESLLGDEAIELEQRDAVAEALRRFCEGRADFADYLIGVKGALLQATTTFTFDRALRRAEGFTWLDSRDQLPEP